MKIPFSKDSNFSNIESIFISTLLLVLVCWYFSVATNGTLLDFSSYYFSTLAFKNGLNPYDYNQVNLLASSSGIKIFRGITYPYHPYTFQLFAPFTQFSFEVAKQLYLLLNIIAISSLVLLWRHTVCSFSDWGFPALLICLLLGPGMPLKYIFITGNVAAFETLLVWGGVALLMNSYVRSSWVCLCLAGFWKVISFAYIPLTLCWHTNKTNLCLLAIMLTVTMCLFLFPLATDATNFSSWITYLMEVQDEVYINHSSLLFFKQLGADFGLSRYAWPIYIGWCTVVLCTYFYVTKRFHISKITPSNITFLLWTAALIMPRVRSYGFLPLVPAVQQLCVRRPLLLAINIISGMIVEQSMIPLVANHGLFLLNILNWGFTIRLLADNKHNVQPLTAPLFPA